MNQKHLPYLEKLADLSTEYGKDELFVLAGGGNTSVKCDEVLYVKASGESLAASKPKSFVALNVLGARALCEKNYDVDPFRREAQVKEALLSTRLEPTTDKRPSVEATLHALLPARFVVHTHPRTVNGLSCAVGGADACRNLFGEKILWLDYVDPGYTLARTVAEQLAAYRAKYGGEPEAILLQNHGVFVGGETPAEVRSMTNKIISTLKQAYEQAQTNEIFSSPASPSASEAWALLREDACAFRAACTAQGHAPGPLVFADDSEPMLSFASAPEGKAACAGGPLTPDQIVYCRSFPLWFAFRADESRQDRSRRWGKEVAAYRKQYGFAPTIAIAERGGMLAAGKTPKDARMAAKVFADAVCVAALTRAFGGARYLTERERNFIENWEVEHYRKKAAEGTTPGGRVQGRVALVTGAAQGFGEGLVRALAAEGAYVVIADLNLVGAQKVAKTLEAEFGADRAMAAEVNIADGDSVSKLANVIVRAYGGLDLVVSNAGILRAGSVKTQPDKDFAAVTNVNYLGYFFCVKYTVPLLAAAHAAVPTYWTDIVQINSKSGLVGSSRNSAYAGGKFGGIGLTQSFALELVEDGIKVNSLCPGNFFDGPLWSDPQNGLFQQYLRAGKVQGARTIEDVRRFYEAKVPMGRGCTVTDVARALFYVVEQAYETGQAVPITGGQVMLS